MKKLIVVQVIGKYFVCDKNGVPDYNAIEANIRLAEEAAIKLWNSGVIGCFTPHLNTRHFEFKARTPEKNYKAFDVTILVRAIDAILRLPNWVNSAGSREEVAICEKRGIPIFDDADELIEWAKKKIKEKSA